HRRIWSKYARRASRATESVDFQFRTEAGALGCAEASRQEQIQTRGVKPQVAPFACDLSDGRMLGAQRLKIADGTQITLSRAPQCDLRLALHHALWPVATQLSKLVSLK